MDERWKSSIDEEINALEKNSACEIIDVPNNKKMVGCKWLFNMKYRPDGNIDRFKARLVAKGYNQMYQIDYMEKFSLVEKMAFIMMENAISASNDFLIIIMRMIRIILKPQLCNEDEMIFIRYESHFLRDEVLQSQGN